MNVNAGRMNSLPRRKAGASLGALAFVVMAAAACGGGGDAGIAPGAADSSSPEIPNITAPTHTTAPVTTPAEGGAAGAEFEPEPETGPEQAITGGGSVPVAPPLPDDDIGAGKQFAAAAASVEFDAEAFARITPGGPRDVDPRRFRQLIDRDVIVPIYDPRVVSAAESGFNPDELVMGVALNGESRAYPVSMMRFREIANDEVGGIPILVTW